MARELPRKRRLMDIWALRLFADPLNGSDKKPFMYFDFKNEEDDRDNPDAKVSGPRVGVNLMTGDKNASMEFVTDPAGIIVMLNNLRDIALGKKDFYKVANTTLFRGQTKLDSPIEDVGLVIARDGEGVFMGLQMYGREKVKFYFVPTARYQWIVGKDGQQLTACEQSCMYAEAQEYILRRGYIAIMEQGYMEYQEEKDFKAKRKSENFRQQQSRQAGNGGGGNGGGWGKPQQQQQQRPQQQQQQSGGEPPMDFDSEIPFAPIGLQYGKMSVYALA